MKRAGRDWAACTTGGPAGRDRIARLRRECGVADSRSDIELVRAILQHLAQEMERGRPAREVLREVWSASMMVLMAARQQGRGEPD